MEASKFQGEPWHKGPNIRSPRLLSLESKIRFMTLCQGFGTPIGPTVALDLVHGGFSFIIVADARSDSFEPMLNVLERPGPPE